MKRFGPRVWVILSLFAACSRGEAPFISGTIWVNPCPFGPTADHCQTDTLPADCDALTPDWHWVGGHLREANASVTLSGTERVGVTDLRGNFRFSDLAPGTVALTVAVPWTVEVRFVQVVEVDDHRVDEDFAADVIAISFTAAGIIEGRVELPRDSPRDDHEYGGLEAVEVQMACPPRSAITDAGGRFRFDNVPQGTRHLTATGTGLVGTADPVLVLRGQTSAVVLQLEYGRPPDQPGNSPPVMNGPITIIPLTDNTSDVTFIRPPAEGMVRGERAALGCSASDPDNDVLQYVWSASSGFLDAGNSPAAVITAGRDDAGVSCTVLDGRGGVAATHRVIEVQDTYFAGASLFTGGAVLSAAYGSEFDLVLWTPSWSGRLTQTGDQWLPQANGSFVAYIDRSTGADALLAGDIDIEGEPPVAAAQIHNGAASFAATDHGVAWVTDQGAALFRDREGNQFVLATGLDPATDSQIATAADTVGVSRGETVELYRVDGAAPSFVNVILTPWRAVGRFATDGYRIAYWSGGKPMLATASTQLELGTDEIPWTTAGRIALTDTHCAYSFYESPLRFVEATVVWLEGDQPVNTERAATGPSEVLDLDSWRLLLGRPRSEESEPSADLWIVDLESLGVEP